MHGVLTVMAAVRITPNHMRGKLGQFTLDRCGLQTSQKPRREVLGFQGPTSLISFNFGKCDGKALEAAAPSIDLVDNEPSVERDDTSRPRSEGRITQCQSANISMFCRKSKFGNRKLRAFRKLLVTTLGRLL